MRSVKVELTNTWYRLSMPREWSLSIGLQVSHAQARGLIHPPVRPTVVAALACFELQGILPLMASPNNIAQLPRMKPGRRGALSQIIEMQGVLAKDALDPDTTPSARAQVARAWEVLEERKRILRMKPKPKDVDVKDLQKPKPRPTTFIE